MRFYSLILRDKQQDLPSAFCDRCHCEQYAEDTLYLLGGLRLCGECIENRIFAMTTPQKAELLGAVPVPARECAPAPTRGTVPERTEAARGGPGARPSE